MLFPFYTTIAFAFDYIDPGFLKERYSVIFSPISDERSIDASPPSFVTLKRRTDDGSARITPKQMPGSFKNTNRRN